MADCVLECETETLVQDNETAKEEISLPPKLNITEIDCIPESVSKVYILDNNFMNFIQYTIDYKYKSLDISKIFPVTDDTLFLITGWTVPEVEDSKYRTDFINKLSNTYNVKIFREENFKNLLPEEVEDKDTLIYHFFYPAVKAYERLNSFFNEEIYDRDSKSFICDSNYNVWVQKLYDEWPYEPKKLKSGRDRKEHAPDITIIVLAELISYFNGNADVVVVGTEDIGLTDFQSDADEYLESEIDFVRETFISFKSKNGILKDLALAYEDSDILNTIHEHHMRFPILYLNENGEKIKIYIEDNDKYFDFIKKTEIYF